MKSFADNKGRTWQVDVTVDAIRRVRALLDVDLLEIAGGTLLERLYRDPVLLCDIVYAVCKPEADVAGVSDEEFGRAMAGDAIDQATAALLEALVDFSPSPKDRANMGRVIVATRNAMDKALAIVGARLDNGELDRAIERALMASTGPSGDSPESSELTPVT